MIGRVPAQAKLLIATVIYLSFEREMRDPIDGEEKQEQTKDRKGLSAREWISGEAGGGMWEEGGNKVPGEP